MIIIALSMTVQKSQGNFRHSWYLSVREGCRMSLINACWPGLTIILQCGDDKSVTRARNTVLMMIAQLIFGDGCRPIHQEFWVYLQSWAISG